MKKKDIYEVSIKIIGIIAAWKFIESIIALVVVYITFQSISTNINIDMMGVSQTNFSVIYFVFIALYGLFGYLLLFQTDKILKLLRLTDPTEVTLQIGKKTIYHIAVLFIGFFMLTYSGNLLTSNTFTTKSPTTTDQTSISHGPTGEKIGTTGVRITETGPSTTMSTTVNYTNILLILLSILIIIKSEKFSGILMPKEKEDLTSSPSQLDVR